MRTTPPRRSVVSATESHSLSHRWELSDKEWARFAEARNVRAGGADPRRGR